MSGPGVFDLILQSPRQADSTSVLQGQPADPDDRQANARAQTQHGFSTIAVTLEISSPGGHQRRHDHSHQPEWRTFRLTAFFAVTGVVYRDRIRIKHPC